MQSMSSNTRNKNYDLQEVFVNQQYETIYKAHLKFDFWEFQSKWKAFGNFSSHQESLRLNFSLSRLVCLTDKITVVVLVL